MGFEWLEEKTSGLYMGNPMQTEKCEEVNEGRVPYTASPASFATIFGMGILHKVKEGMTMPEIVEEMGERDPLLEEDLRKNFAGTCRRKDSE